VRHDEHEHTGTAELAFEVAPLPPEFTIDGLKAGDTLTADRKVTLKVGTSQTPATSAAPTAPAPTPAQPAVPLTIARQEEERKSR